MIDKLNTRGSTIVYRGTLIFLTLLFSEICLLLYNKENYVLVIELRVGGIKLSYVMAAKYENKC